MINPSIALEVSLQAMLEKHNLNINDTIIKKHTFNIDSLINGETDLMAAYISNEPHRLLKRGILISIFDPKEEGFDFYSDILFVSADELKNNEQRSIDFSEASLKGWEYAFENIDETIAIIQQKYNSQNKSRDALLYEAHELKKLSYFRTDKLGRLEKEKLQKIYDMYSQMGLLNSEINIDDIFYHKRHKLLTIKEEQYLKDKKSINVCVDPNWTPYESIENGKHIGMSADYMELIKQSTHTEINLVQTKSWAQSLSFVKNKKCDVLPLAMQTQERKKYLNFTKPYINTSLVIATKPNVPFINDFSTLKNKKIGITKGYATADIIKRTYPFIDIIEVQSAEAGLKRVLDGSLFGYIGGVAHIGHLFQKSFMGELKITGKLDAKLNLAIAVRNDDEILVNILDKFLDAISISTKQGIKNRWIAITYEERIDYSLVYKIIAMFSVILIIIFFYYLKQKKLYK